MNLTTYRKSVGFLFFVISISGGHHHQARAHHQPVLAPVFRIRIRIHRIHMLLNLPDPDPQVRGMDPDPDPSIIKQ